MLFSSVETLITQDVLAKRIEELGKELTERYKNHADLVIICTLKGSVLFVADLIRHMDIPLEIDFISIASYHGGLTSTGDLRVLHGMSTDVKGRPVLIVEDIVDTGRTLTKLKEMLAEMHPSSVEVCALLDKPSRRVVSIESEYVGFTIEDLFVVGYGLDYQQLYRNLPFIGVLSE
ncbi:hypoxanthine phosphoribosyltransferase [Entomospira nematocerorum]|uniref:Hypoxanthine phosphoribosyltransferase n=1 Tax=Entomospira nematocerorum TaxID=2719987 RepID=A0A968GEZ7_9SPIO|nr:hypoxanthine phosphoribosyltransferase [Entomospira nematocera]NIZ46993.1 hypoxanthine phosphoribosyltransferase [Entomospira nematocera]WDI34463.1 hypoxanthine phosphoribosyltransferase [Entomospira nematocera]